MSPNRLDAQITTPIGITGPQDIMSSAETGLYTLLIGKTFANGTTTVLSNIPECSDAMIKGAKRRLAQYLIDNEEAMEIAKKAVDCNIDESGFKFYQLPLGAVDEAINAANDELSERETMIAQSDAMFKFS